jgi:hypothetical protein
LESAYQELIHGIIIGDSLITLNIGAGHMNIGSNVTEVICQLIDNDDCYYLHAVYCHHPHTLNRPEYAFRALLADSVWSLRALVDTGSDITRFYRGGRNPDLTLPDIHPLLFAACHTEKLNYDVFNLLSAYDAIGRTHFSFVRLSLFRLVAIGASRPEERGAVLRIMELIARDVTQAHGTPFLAFVLSRRGRLCEWRRGIRQLFPFTDLRVLFEKDDAELLVLLLDLGLDAVNIYGANAGGYLAARLGAIKCLTELARRGFDVSARKRLVDMLYKPLMVELLLLDSLWFLAELLPHIVHSIGMWLVIDTPRRAALVLPDKICLEFIDDWVANRRAGLFLAPADCELFVKQWAEQKKLHLVFYDMCYISL